MNGSLLILAAEDDANDILLLKRAFLKNGVNNPVHASPDGEDAIAYLQGKGVYQDRSKFPFPALILTDIKMPKTGGFELLSWLQKHPECQVIPTIVLSSSKEGQDVRRAYQLGANAYIQKPSTLEQLVRATKIIMEFWDICEKPPLPDHCRA